MLGTITAILSLAAVMQAYGKFDFKGIPEAALSVYRECASIAKGLLLDWWVPFSIPDWAFDLLVFWVTMFAGSIRMAMAAQSHWLTLGRDLSIPVISLITNFILAPLHFIQEIFNGLFQWIEWDSNIKLIDTELADSPEIGIDAVRRRAHGGLMAFIWGLSIVIGVPAFFLWSALSG
ncbi:MAG: hypothetical protein AAGF20_04525 [Pseudomonadota bacterium]